MERGRCNDLLRPRANCTLPHSGALLGLGGRWHPRHRATSARFRIRTRLYAAVASAKSHPARATPGCCVFRKGATVFNHPEDLLSALPFPLTHGVPGATGLAGVDRAPAPAGGLLGDVGRHSVSTGIPSARTMPVSRSAVLVAGVIRVFTASPGRFSVRTCPQ